MAEKSSKKESVRDTIIENADKSIHGYDYLKRLSPEEIEEEKTILSQLAITIQDLEEEKREIVEEYKGKIKPLSHQFGITRGNIKSGVKSVTETVYVFFDKEKRTATIFSDEGIEITSRPMTPDELQIKLYPDEDI